MKDLKKSNPQSPGEEQKMVDFTLGDRELDMSTQWVSDHLKMREPSKENSKADRKALLI